MISIKTIRQQSFNDCGYSCVSMIIKIFLNKKISIPTLKMINNLDDRALDFEDIENIFNFFGLKSDAYKTIDAKDLIDSIKRPIIAQILNSDGILHFVVVRKFEKNRFYILDPSKEKEITLSIEELFQIFQGFFMTIRIGKLKKIKDDIKIPFDWIWTRNLFISLIFKVIFTVGLLVESRFIKIYSTKINDDVIQEIVLFCLLGVMNILFSRISGFIINNIKNKSEGRFYSNIKELHYNLEEDVNLSDNQKLLIANNYKNYFNYLWSTRIDITIGFICNFLILFLIFEINIVILLLTTIEIAIKITFISFFKRNDEKQIYELDFYANNIFKVFENSKFALEPLISIIDKIFFYILMALSINQIRDGSVLIQDIFIIITIKRFMDSFFNSLIFIVKNKDTKINLLIKTKWLNSKKKRKLFDKITKIEFINASSKYNEIENKQLINLKINKNHYIKYEQNSWDYLKLLAMPIEFNGIIKVNNRSLKELDLQNKINYLNSTSYKNTLTPMANLIPTNSRNMTWDILKILNGFGISIPILSLVSTKKLSLQHKQIIMFINAFLSDKDVFIFENALSNIDGETKKTLFDLFAEHHKESIIIIHDIDVINIV